MKRVIAFLVVFLFLNNAGLYSQEYYESKPIDIPGWAEPGSFRFIRIDGGPIEVEKAKLSSWGLHFSEVDNEVLGKIYDRYSDDIISLLKDACFDWIWVTYSNGFSLKEETVNRALCKSFLKKCHKNGIRVTAYFSMTNMFWVSMFVDEPQSVKWLNFVDGRPQIYGRVNVYRFQADINNQSWRDYLKRKVKLALEAGFDAIFFDNLQANIKGIKSFLSEIQDMAENYRKDSYKPLVYCNAHLGLERLKINDICDKIWNEYGHSSVVTSDRRWSVNNIRKTKYILSSRPYWKPQCYDITRFLRGRREEVAPLPKEQKLGIAEARAFGSALGRCIEGPFLRSLIKKESDALVSWNAVSSYNRFTKKNEDYYINVNSPANIAVVTAYEPTQSERRRAFDFTLQTMFIKKSILIDIIPINQITSLEKIGNYKLIFLTDNRGIEQNLKTVLQEYLEKGGKILSFKDIHFLDEEGFEYVSDSEKEDVIKYGYSERLIDKTNKLTGGPQVSISGGDFILGNAMIKSNRSKLFVHIVNYYEKPVQNVNLKIFISALGFVRKTTSIVYNSPDNTDFRIIRNDKGYVEININNLDTYGIVELQ